MARFELKMVIGFLLTLGIFSVLGAYTYFNNKAQLDTGRRIAHSTEVLLVAQSLLNDLLSAETGQRGFVISGQDEYLEPYVTSLSKIDETLKLLKRLTFDNPVQQAAIENKLHTLVRNRLQVIDRIIKIRAQGFEPARDSLLTLGGKETMDSIRTVVAHIQQVEVSLLEDRRIENEKKVTSFNYAYVATGLLIVIILNVLFLIIYKNLKMRKAAEGELLCASAEIRDLYDNAPCGYLSVDQSMLLTNANQTLLNWLGYKSDEVIHKMVFEDLLSEEGKLQFRSSFDEDIEKYKKQGYVKDLEFEIRRKDGTNLSVVVNSVVLFDVNGNFVKSSSSVFDNTARKKAEQERDNFFDNSLDLMVILSMNGTFLSWNRAWKNILGYNNSDLENINISRLIHPDDLERTLDTLRDKLGAGESLVSFENRYRAKDGTDHWLLWNAVPLLDKGVVYGFARDITDRRQSEERITELNKELEAFTYSVSHDLRSPLRAISGYAQILKEDYFDIFDEEAKRVTNVIISGANRMGKLIDDLLDFSRMGRKDLSFSNLNMREIVDNIFQDMLSDNEKAMEIKVLPLTPCKGDLSMLRQVWTNLISNALKYSSKKTKTEIEIGSFNENGTVCYYISDKGAGFDMKYRDKLFGVFQRLHKVKEFEGTGVGLALVKRIIDRHGGSVWAEGKIN
ncbi:MAG: hypothetical protein C0490_12365, partial [Marivirga sp.]|nr:hypothetical protein [Marivirga sp.]